MRRRLHGDLVEVVERAADRYLAHHLQGGDSDLVDRPDPGIGNVGVLARRVEGQRVGPVQALQLAHDLAAVQVDDAQRARQGQPPHVTVIRSQEQIVRTRRRRHQCAASSRSSSPRGRGHRSRGALHRTRDRTYPRPQYWSRCVSRNRCGSRRGSRCRAGGRCAHRGARRSARGRSDRRARRGHPSDQHRDSHDHRSTQRAAQHERPCVRSETRKCHLPSRHSSRNTTWADPGRAACRRRGPRTIVGRAWWLRGA